MQAEAHGLGAAQATGAAHGVEQAEGAEQAGAELQVEGSEQVGAEEPQDGAEAHAESLPFALQPPNLPKIPASADAALIATTVTVAATK